MRITLPFRVVVSIPRQCIGVLIQPFLALNYFEIEPLQEFRPAILSSVENLGSSELLQVLIIGIDRYLVFHRSQHIFPFL